MTQNRQSTKRLTLVNCCREKLSRIAPARDMYRSVLFQKSKTWADKQGNDWFVISARYGLINPDSILAPYDRTMRSLTPIERAEWASDVELGLRALLPFWDVDRMEITLLAGADYAGWVPLVSDFATVYQPMAGLQIGQRLQWLNQQLVMEAA